MHMTLYFQWKHSGKPNLALVTYEVLQKHKHVSYAYSNLVLTWKKQPEM